MDHHAGVGIALVPVFRRDAQLAVGKVGPAGLVLQDWCVNVVIFRQGVVVLEPLDGKIAGNEVVDQASEGQLC